MFQRSFKVLPYTYNDNPWPHVRGKFSVKWHNLNKFGRGPLEDVTYNILKVFALLFQTWRFLKFAFFENRFWPCNLLMPLTGIIWTTLIGDYTRIIPAKFGKNQVSGSREDVDDSNCWRRTEHADGQGGSQKLTMNTLCSAELKNVTAYQDVSLNDQLYNSTNMMVLNCSPE